MSASPASSTSPAVMEAEKRTQEYVPRLVSKLNADGAYKTTDVTLKPATEESKVDKYVGKVRDRYDNGKVVCLITTDRLSAFDRQLTCIPFKGAVLNGTSRWWFNQTKHIVNNHVIENEKLNRFCPNVTLGRKCVPFPIEFVMRGYMTGSSGTAIWTHYNKGVRKYCGHDLPDGLIKNVKLPTGNLLTPTTKSDVHDELISAEELVERGIMTQEDWDFCAEKAHALFAFGQKTALEHGFILVDTKYEFGRDVETNEILLIDEIHSKLLEQITLVFQNRKRYRFYRLSNFPEPYCLLNLKSFFLPFFHFILYFFLSSRLF